MKKLKIILLIITNILLLTGCSNSSIESAYQNIDEKTAELLIKEKNPVILDVRTQEEYDEKHLKNTTLLIPYDEIENRLAELLPFKDREILVYCRTGRRSEIAAKTLSSQGFLKIYNLNNGITGLSPRSPLL